MTVYSLAAFAEKVRILSDSFTLSDGEMKVGRTRGGGIVRAQNGARLWHGSITLAPHYPSAMREVGTLIRALQEPDALFEMVDPFAAFPRSDPTGSTISGSTPQVDSIADDGRSVDLIGLPEDYVLARGDRFSIQYSDMQGNAFRGYHEIQDEALADAGGSAAGVKISPSIGQGGIEAYPYFVTPHLVAMLVPGSVRSAVRSRGIEQGWSFDWQQVPIL